MRLLCSWASTAALAIVLAPIQGRNVNTLPNTDAGVIAGVVVDDELPPVPVRRAVVTISGPGMMPGRSAITDENGRFRFTNVPAGSIGLTAERPPYLTSAYGAKRAGGIGTAIPLEDGQSLDGLVLRIWRGAVVAGVIHDDGGVPLSGIAVTAVSTTGVHGRGLLTLTNNGSKSDDRGEYRIFGLEPGSYLLEATPVAGNKGPATVMSDAQMDAILAGLRARGPAPLMSPATGPSLRPFQYSPVFYPSEVNPSRAAPISLTAGEERTGVDITLVRVPTATVSGSVTRPDGSAPAGVTLVLMTERAGRLPGVVNLSDPTGVTDAAGQFHFVHVPAGDYVLIARAPIRSEAAGPTQPVGSAEQYWARQDVKIAGDDVGGIALTLRRGLTVRGRVAFLSSSNPGTAPPELAGMRVGLIASANSESVARDKGGLSTTAAIAPDGGFVLVGVIPSVYAFQFFPLGRSMGPWFLKSARMDDLDLLDGPEVFSREDSPPILVTLSDRHTTLTGRFSTVNGAAVSDFSVIAFSEDPRFWGPHSRRIQAVRPGLDGRFLFADLPPGEYLLGAVTDVDDGEWFDKAFLENLRPNAVRVSIADGKDAVQDIRIGGR